MTWRVHVLFPMLLWLLTAAKVASAEQETVRGSLKGESQRSIKGSVNKSSRGAYMGRVETLLQKRQEIPEVKTMIQKVQKSTQETFKNGAMVMEMKRKMNMMTIDSTGKKSKGMNSLDGNSPNPEHYSDEEVIVPSATPHASFDEPAEIPASEDEPVEEESTKTNQKEYEEKNNDEDDDKDPEAEEGSVGGTTIVIIDEDDPFGVFDCSIAYEMDLNERVAVDQPTADISHVMDCEGGYTTEDFRMHVQGAWYKVKGTGNSLKAYSCPALLSIYKGECIDLMCVESQMSLSGCEAEWMSINGQYYHILVQSSMHMQGAGDGEDEGYNFDVKLVVEEGKFLSSDGPWEDDSEVGDEGGTTIVIIDEDDPFGVFDCSMAYKMNLNEHVAVDQPTADISHVMDCEGGYTTEDFRMHVQGAWYKVKGTGNSLKAYSCPALLSIYKGECNDLMCVESQMSLSGCEAEWMSINGQYYHILVHGSMHMQGAGNGEDEGYNFDVRLVVEEGEIASSDGTDDIFFLGDEGSSVDKDLFIEECETNAMPAPIDRSIFADFQVAINDGFTPCGNAIIAPDAVNARGAWFTVAGEGHTVRATSCPFTLSVFDGSCADLICANGEHSSVLTCEFEWKTPDSGVNYILVQNTVAGVVYSGPFDLFINRIDDFPLATKAPSGSQPTLAPLPGTRKPTFAPSVRPPGTESPASQHVSIPETRPPMVSPEGTPVTTVPTFAVTVEPTNDDDGDDVLVDECLANSIGIFPGETISSDFLFPLSEEFVPCELDVSRTKRKAIRATWFTVEGNGHVLVAESCPYQLSVYSNECEDLTCSSGAHGDGRGCSFQWKSSAGQPSHILVQSTINGFPDTGDISLSLALSDVGTQAPMVPTASKQPTSPVLPAPTFMPQTQAPTFEQGLFSPTMQRPTFPVTQLPMPTGPTVPVQPKPTAVPSKGATPTVSEASPSAIPVETTLAPTFMPQTQAPTFEQSLSSSTMPRPTFLATPIPMPTQPTVPVQPKPTTAPSKDATPTVSETSPSSPAEATNAPTFMPQTLIPTPEQSLSLPTIRRPTFRPAPNATTAPSNGATSAIQGPTTTTTTLEPSVASTKEKPTPDFPAIVSLQPTMIPPTESPSHSPLASTEASLTASPTSEAPFTTTPPSTGRPATLSPATGSPSTGTPATLSPTASSPSTGTPSTLSPTTSSPTTVGPSTGTPTTLAPITGVPTTGSPTTLAPIKGVPTTDSPTTLSPATANPTTLSPTTANPTLSPAPTFAAPRNDDCVGSIRLNLGETIETSTRGATQEPRGLDTCFRRDVVNTTTTRPGIWYSIDLQTSPSSMERYRIDACNGTEAATAPVHLTLYESDNNGCDVLICAVTINHVGCALGFDVPKVRQLGLTYKLLVQQNVPIGDPNAGGEFELSWLPAVVPANDACLLAENLDVGDVVVGTAFSATPEDPAIMGICDRNNSDIYERLAAKDPIPAVWYRMLVGGRVKLLASACGSERSELVYVTVYTGDCNNLQCQSSATPSLRSCDTEWEASSSESVYFILVERVLESGTDNGEFELVASLI